MWHQSLQPAQSATWSMRPLLNGWWLLLSIALKYDIQHMIMVYIKLRHLFTQLKQSIKNGHVSLLPNGSDAKYGYGVIECPLTFSLPPPCSVLLGCDGLWSPFCHLVSFCLRFEMHGGLLPGVQDEWWWALSLACSFSPLVCVGLSELSWRREKSMIWVMGVSGHFSLFYCVSGKIFITSLITKAMTIETTKKRK